MEEKRLKMSTGRERQNQLGVKTQLNLYGSRLIRIDILLYERLVQTFVYLDQDPHSSIREISSNPRLSYGTVQTILLEDLTLKKVCPRRVLHILTEDQKRQRVLCARK